MLLFSLIILLWQDHVLLLASPFNQSVVSSLQVLFILSSFAYHFNQSAVWNPSYPLCHSFNSSGGGVLLISSSILSSCQVHVEFFPFTVGVLPKLHHSFFLLYLVNRSVVVIDSYCSIIHLFLTGVLSEFGLPCSFFLTECFQLCSSSLNSFFQFVQPR